MKTQRILQATSLAFLAMAIFVFAQGWSLGVQGMYGPGPGFFAAVVGTALIFVSFIWFCQITFRPKEASLQPLEVSRDGLTRVALVLAALLSFAFLLRPLGFNLTMFGLLLLLLVGYSREYTVVKLVLAIFASFGTHYVFERILRVPLPYSSIPWLRDLGF